VILFYNDYFGYGSGAGKAAIDILTALLSTKKEIVVITNRTRTKLPKSIEGTDLEKPGWIRVPRRVSFPNEINKKLPRNIARWFIRGIQDILCFNYNRNIKKITPDLVFVNTVSAHAIFMNYKPQRNTKSIFIVHGSPTQMKYPGYGGGKYSFDYMINAMEQYYALIFVSSRTKMEWLSHKSLLKKKSFYIPNCADEPRILSLMQNSRNEIRKQLGIPPNKFIAICVANIQYMKGQDILVNNFEKLIKIAPDLILYLAGGIIYPWSENLVQQIQSSNFKNQLNVLGLRRDALEFIFASDLFILPTRGEAMPLSILEAMALKTPVLASNVDGIPELIEDEKDGLLFNSEDSEKMIQQFVKFYSNKDKRNAYAKSAQKKYWKEFSRKKQIEKYSNLLEELLCG